MTDRRSVILLFFDLPLFTQKDKREYMRFKKHLKKAGYSSVQKSVLIKLIHNSSTVKRELKKLKEISPQNGSVYALPVCIADFMKLYSASSEKFDFEFFTGDTVYV